MFLPRLPPATWKREQHNRLTTERPQTHLLQCQLLPVGRNLPRLFVVSPGPRDGLQHFLGPFLPAENTQKKNKHNSCGPLAPPLNTIKVQDDGEHSQWYVVLVGFQQVVVETAVARFLLDYQGVEGE